MDFSKAQSRIVPYIISRDWNRSLLEQCPYEEVADLAVTYHVLPAIPQWQHSSVLITNTMMQQWGTDAQTLHELALHNLPYMLPGRLQKMNDILKSYGIPNIGDTDLGIYILSSERMVNGSSIILNTEMMKGVVEILGEDCLLIPSSVHEWIILSSVPKLDLAPIEKMVREINKAEVAVDERLSDHAYRYTLDRGLVSA